MNSLTRRQVLALLGAATVGTGTASGQEVAGGVEAGEAFFSNYEATSTASGWEVTIDGATYTFTDGGDTVGLPDGADATEIVLPNGNTASEVIAPDGTTVFSAIPDAEDLHARYDATELSLNDGDSVSTWSDQTGNGHDLTAGTAPTYVASGINGNPAISFDGVDDFLDVAFSTLSQPNTIFAVFRFDSFDSSNYEYFYNGETNNGENGFGVNRDGDFFIRAGNDTGAVAADTNNHISSALYNSTSELRLDGTQEFSGDVGTDGLDGFRVGNRASSGEHGEVTVGEILVYPQDKSGIYSDVESYLSDKWGVTT